MKIKICSDKIEAGRYAAEIVVEGLRKAIAERHHANLIVATGASQFELLTFLVQADVDWSKVTAFHLDEYVGMPESHPASFRRYLRERFVELVRTLRMFHYVNGEVNPEAECQRLGKLILEYPIDVACVGIGENGHLAFNDPPADFETEKPYLVVDLDAACRRQQMGEGWFKSIDDVPAKAISMSCRQIMKSRCIVCTVPDARKAEAVRNTVEREISNQIPATILRGHNACHLVLDENSASLLSASSRDSQ